MTRPQRSGKKGPAVEEALKAQPALEKTSSGIWLWPLRVGIKGGEKGLPPPSYNPHKHTTRVAANLQIKGQQQHRDVHIIHSLIPKCHHNNCIWCYCKCCPWLPGVLLQNPASPYEALFFYEVVSQNRPDLVPMLKDFYTLPDTAGISQWSAHPTLPSARARSASRRHLAASRDCAKLDICCSFIAGLSKIFSLPLQVMWDFSPSENPVHACCFIPLVSQVGAVSSSFAMEGLLSQLTCVV